MTNVTQEDLSRLADEIWTFQALDVHLYRLAVALEPPNALLLEGRAAEIVTPEGDWKLHFACGVAPMDDARFQQMAAGTPIRALVLHHALRAFLEQLPEGQAGAAEAVIATLCERMERHVVPDASANLWDLVESELKNRAGGPALRLALHLQEANTLEHVKELTDLDLTREPFAGELAPHIAALVNLKRLSLSHSNITDDDLYCLRSLEHLEHLNLSHTSVSGMGVESVLACPSLKALDVADTNVNDLAIPVLKRIAKLERLRLPQRWFHAGQIEALKRALPNCLIETA